MSVKLTTAVWEQSTVDGAVLLVLLKLADNAHEETGIAWPSVAYLAKHCRVHERTVQRALKTLVNTGEIEVADTSYGRSVNYRILIGAAGCHPGLTPPVGVTSDPSDVGRDVTQTVSKEEPPIEPPGEELDEIETLYQHYYTNYASPGRVNVVAGPSLRTHLGKALKEAPLQTCIDAVDGAMKFWAAKGQKHGVGRVFRTGMGTESLAERIEFFASQSANTVGGSHTVQSDHYDAVRAIRAGIDNPDSADYQRIAAEHEQALNERGYEVQRADGGRFQIVKKA